MHCVECGDELVLDPPMFVEDPDRGLLCLKCAREAHEENENEAEPTDPHEQL